MIQELEYFDPISYFQEKGIQYWTEGKNVSSGWVNIQCINPLCDDHSNHLGINLATKRISCWKCGKRGDAINLIMEIEGCSFPTAKEIIKRHTNTTLLPAPAILKTPPLNPVALPKSAQKKIPLPHYAYLQKRGYNAPLLRDKYKLQFCWAIGKYRHRIIAPIYMNNILVNFIARDITGLSNKKYVMYSDNQAEGILYNFDNIKTNSVAIVEGVFDVWRIGDGAIGILGTNLTEEKIALLIARGIQKVFVIYDDDAAQRQDEVANKLSKLIQHTEKITITGGDPDKYFLKNSNDLKELKFLMGF